MSSLVDQYGVRGYVGGAPSSSPPTDARLYAKAIREGYPFPPELLQEMVDTLTEEMRNGKRSSDRIRAAVALASLKEHNRRLLRDESQENLEERRLNLEKVQSALRSLPPDLLAELRKRTLLQDDTPPPPALLEQREEEGGGQASPHSGVISDSTASLAESQSPTISANAPLMDAKPGEEKKASLDHIRERASGEGFASWGGREEED